MLTVLFVVLGAAYALFLLFMVFVADVSNVDSLRGTAAFLLVIAAVAFGALMFFGSGTMSDIEEEAEEDMAAPTATPPAPLPAAAAAPSPAVCASCGQENPDVAKFCFACGTSLSPEAPEEEAMPDQPTMTKADVLQKLRDGGKDALKRLRAMPEDAFEGGRYENGWTARQILAHIASIEWTYPRLVDLARDGPPAPPSPSAPSAPASPAAPILSYNDRQVEKRADYTIGQLLDELETNRAATIAAIEAADESLFSIPVKSAGGAQGTLAEVLNYVAVLHVATHVDDITRS